MTWNSRSAVLPGVVVLCLAALLARGGEAGTYAITDLGDLADCGSWANALNDSGHVAGWSANAVGTSKAFLYRDGVMLDLGIGESGRSSYAMSVNNSGQVVGHYDVLVGGGVVTHPFEYKDGVLTDLGFDGCAAFGNNDRGQIVGAQAVGSAEHAFLYYEGAMNDLGTLGGTNSRAYEVNESGQVAGYSDTAGGFTHAFLYSASGMTDLGTLGGYLSLGYAINDSGEVVGYSSMTASGVVHAFLYTGGIMKDLGTIGGTGSFARDINKAGQVVGSARTATGSTHAILYDGDTMYDLNSLIPAASGWELGEARGINEFGQIVGWGGIGGGTHAFLLTPVPEPITMIFFGTGLAGVFGFVARRRMQKAA